jgi:hypothetical protein
MLGRVIKAFALAVVWIASASVLLLPAGNSAQANVPGLQVMISCPAEIDRGETGECQALVTNQTGQTVDVYAAMSQVNNFPCPPSCLPPPFAFTSAAPAFTSGDEWSPLASQLQQGASLNVSVSFEAVRPSRQEESYLICIDVWLTPPQDKSACTSVITIDWDDDGCRDRQEDIYWPPESGGYRSPVNFWDFFDTPDSSNVRDKVIAGPDFFRVLSRFGATGDPMIDPLSTPPAAPAYHTAFDRGPSGGPNPWNLTAADGAITGQDFFAILAQFGHSCE